MHVQSGACLFLILMYVCAHTTESNTHPGSQRMQYHQLHTKIHFHHLFEKESSGIPFMSGFNGFYFPLLQSGVDIVEKSLKMLKDSLK